MDRAELLERLEAFGQSHVLRFWDQLDPAQRESLAAQIEATDLQLIQSLARDHAATADWEELARRADPPPAITREQFLDPSQYEPAVEVGRDAITAGKVAMILTAGGQGTRLGFEHPKGMYPIGPVSHASLYQIIIEKVMRRARQFGSRIPLYVMTSPPTHDESGRFLEAHDWFGLNRDDARLFCQGVMPAVDFEGRLLLAQPGALFQSPDGHGGMLAALTKSGCLAEMRERGIEYVFYGQVDNPLIQACDPALVGFHILNQSEMTTQVVRKQNPLQRVGNVVSIDGRVQIIEYSDLPEWAARQTQPDGSLKFWAGSIAVHIFDRPFLERCQGQADSLPFHLARKKVPYIDEVGNSIDPSEPNAIKFERFIFDLLPRAHRAIVCEVDPADGFCAVKNAPPAESETPGHVRRAIVELHRRWLVRSGVDVPENVDVEISPLLAVDEHDLRDIASAIAPITETAYLGPSRRPEHDASIRKT